MQNNDYDNYHLIDNQKLGIREDYNYKTDCTNKFFQRHFHDDYEILFITEVTGEYTIENHKYNLMPYDLLLIKPAKYHYLQVKEHTHYGRFVFNITPEFIRQDIIDKAFAKGEFFHIGGSSPITKNFMKLLDYNKAFDESEFILLIKAILTENLLLISKIDSNDNGENYHYLDEFNTKVMHYIRENLTSITSLDQMAQDLYVSKSTLYHSFKRVMKISIMQYVRNKKVLNAHSLIKSGVRPTKAAVMSGFDDYTTFYRSYKLFFGHSPNESQ